MSEVDSGNPAFPITAGNQVYNQGMTLRDWFAGQVLAGIMSGYWANDNLGCLEADVLAQQAYQAADAMIVARQPKRPEDLK